MKMMDSGRFKKMVFSAMKVPKKTDKFNDAMEKRLLITPDKLISDDSQLKNKNRQISAHVPKGFMAVYIGPNHLRFVIPTKLLSVPEFKNLMDKAAEEYEYKQQGGLRIPCDEDDFQELLLACQLYSQRYHHQGCITPAIHV